ncbi:alginate export family protein [Flammeovirga sp. EKP202]|uniref:alginate export family protein n=1 Tax=Flammeovirga sp. EKP202 TaxID=2770592 RepID=UPI00165F2D3D|nr:alginate export family protein [Flammeovirga sp. EKP202]MBD0400026.1 alginate export family protein [Flammeovirga sp. EKP202]
MPKLLKSSALVLILLSDVIVVIGQELETIYPLPSYADRRYKEVWKLEEWSDRDARAQDWSDVIKNIPLSNNKKIWASFGGQVRVRYMPTVNEEFLPQNSGLFTLRMRAHADIHFGENFRVFAEGIYSNTTKDNSERLGAGTPVTKGAFLNLFAEYKFDLYKQTDLGVWVGRRELQAGHERLLSPGNWLITRRTFDGAGFYIGNDNNKLTGFISKPVIPVPDGYTTRDQNTTFWGLRYESFDVAYNSHAGFGVPSWSSFSKTYFEPYFYGLHRQNAVYEEGVADENRYTVGFLLSGPIKRVFNYEVEAMYQFGTFGGKNISAYSITTEFGVSFPKIALQPHIWLRFDYSSGDQNKGDGTLNTFNPLFPQVAQFFGEHGAMDRKNLTSFSANVDFTAFKKVKTRLTYWNFMRSSLNDAVYNTSNGILRSGASSARDLGDSFQISTIISINRHWEICATYNLWEPGQYFWDTQAGKAHTQHFFMITTQFTF